MGGQLWLTIRHAQGHQRVQRASFTAAASEHFPNPAAGSPQLLLRTSLRCKHLAFILHCSGHDLCRRVVDVKFPAQLETASVGVGDARAIHVYKKGHGPKKEATEEQQTKAGRLYKYACEAGMAGRVSRDELLERVMADDVPGACVHALMHACLRATCWSSLACLLSGRLSVCMCACISSLFVALCLFVGSETIRSVLSSHLSVHLICASYSAPATCLLS